jgi:hypothetical protein
MKRQKYNNKKKGFCKNSSSGRRYLHKIMLLRDVLLLIARNRG